MALNVSTFADAASVLREAFTKTSGVEDTRLAVLSIHLNFQIDGPEMDLTVSMVGSSEDDEAQTWRVPLSLERAKMKAVEPNPTLDLPEQVCAGLKVFLARANVDPDYPLWLDLKRPYGFLGAAPWDDFLSSTLDRPVLRLPDMLQPPRENTDVLEAAILFDPDPDMNTDKAIGQVVACANRIHAASNRLQTRVNVFAAGLWADSLQTAPFAGAVTVHKHEDATQAGVNPTRGAHAPELRRTTPWTDWMSDAMKGRSLDALFFICRAVATDCGTSLLLSSQPFAQHRRVALLDADVEEISAMLTRLGSWAALFAAPVDEPSPGAVAVMADALARARPGPVLYQSPAADRDPDRLAAAMRVLFSSAAAKAPMGFGGFLYCYPAVLKGRLAVPPILKSFLASSSFIAERAPWVERALMQATSAIPGLAARQLSQVPDWASAAQRYFETVALEQLRRAGSDVLLSAKTRWSAPETTDDAKAADSQVVRETLSNLQKIIGDYAKSASRTREGG